MRLSPVTCGVTVNLIPVSTILVEDSPLSSITRIEIWSPMNTRASVLSRVDTCGDASTSVEASPIKFEMAIWRLLSRRLAVMAVLALPTAGVVPFPFGKDWIAPLIRLVFDALPEAAPATAAPGVSEAVPTAAVQSTPSSRASSLFTTTSFAVIIIWSVSTSSSVRAFAICSMRLSVS